MTFQQSDSAATFIDEVSAEIGRKPEATRWKEILEENLFDTCGSLNAMGSEDWLALGLPLSMFVILQKRVPNTKESLG